MDILMPQLGETVAEGTVTVWHKRVGDPIRADESLFDVETDKVATEIPSPVAGIVTEIFVPAGATVKVGTRLAVVRDGTGTRSSGPETSADRPGSTPAADRAGEPAPASSGAAKLSPVVRRLLAEHGLDAGEITGTGRDGRITREDVQAHVATRAAAAKPAAAAPPTTASPTASPPPAAVPTPSPPPARTPAPAALVPAPVATPAPAAAGGADTVLPLNNIRRRSAAALARAWTAVPHVLQAVEADFSRVEAVRRAVGSAWQSREGFELTYLPFIALAVCRALARYPQLNARLDGDSLVLLRRVHLGIAVDLDHEGLVVPIVKDAQDRTLPALAREIRRLATGARAHRLTPDDHAQPTYTLSNSGTFGTLITAPIVNPPQVAILSTDGVRKRAVVVESPEGDSLAIRPVGVLAQSFDHRAIDGAYSAAFLREVRRVLETRDWAEDLAS